MARTIAEKLQIKPDTELLFGPSTPEQRALLDPLPEGVTVIDGINRDTEGVAVMFAHNRDSIWKRAEESGWILNGNISLSDTWSSVRLKPSN